MENLLRQYYQMLGKTPLTDSPGEMHGFSNSLQQKQHQIEMNPGVNNPANRSYFDGYQEDIHGLEKLMRQVPPNQRKTLLELFYQRERQGLDKSLNMDQFHNANRQNNRNMREMDRLRLPGSIMDRMDTTTPWGRFM